MPVGSADHTTNSGSTSAERERGLGGRAAPTYLSSAAERPPPRRGLLPRPQEAAAEAVGCLRGRPRPRLAGGEPGLSWRAFPFSTADNLLGGAMKKKEKQDGMDRKGRRRPVLIAREGQPPASTITGNHDPFCMQGPVNSCSCRGVVRKQGCPRPINRHAAPKATGCLGPWRFTLAPSLLC